MIKNKKLNLSNATKITLSLASIFTPIFLNSNTTKATMGPKLGAFIRISGARGGFSNYMRGYVNTGNAQGFSSSANRQGIKTLSNPFTNRNNGNINPNPTSQPNNSLSTYTRTPLDGRTSNVAFLTKMFEDMSKNNSSSDKIPTSGNTPFSTSQKLTTASSTQTEDFPGMDNKEIIMLGLKRLNERVVNNNKKLNKNSQDLDKLLGMLKNNNRIIEENNAKLDDSIKQLKRLSKIILD